MLPLQWLAASALLLGTATSAYSQDRHAMCRSPRAAVESLLYWQQPAQYNPELAATCLETSLLPDREIAIERARQIKGVLDAQGLFVHLDQVPADPNYTNPDGRQQFVLFPRQPDIYVEKVGDLWLWSARTVRVAPDLHRQLFIFDTDSVVSRLPGWARQETLGIAMWKWIGLLLAIFAAVLVRAVVTFLLVAQAKRTSKRFNIQWGRNLLVQVSRPLGTLVGVGVVAIVLPALQFPVRTTQIGLLAVRVMAALSAVWALYRVVDLLSAWMEEKASRTETKLDDQLVPLVRRALKIFVVAVGVIFVLQNLNIDVASLLAGLGLGGLAFALAAKDTVANVFGSATIFVDKPFQIGDWVTIAGTEGIVEQVGFRSTRIRTFYNSLVSIPNSKVADSTIDNYGAREFRRCFAMLGVAYHTQPEQIQAFCDGIRAIIKANPYTRKDFYEVQFSEFGDYSLKIMLYFFFKVSNWSEEIRERHNIFLEIIRLAKDLKVDFAFPTQTLHVDTLAQASAQRAMKIPAAAELGDIVQAYGPEGSKAQPAGPKITHGFLVG